MVADDLLLTATTPYNMQTALNIAEEDARRERYKFNIIKTKTIPINCDTPPTFILNGKPLGTSNSEPHLGINRNHNMSNIETVENRIKSARATIMSLLPTGMRGYNGAGLEVCTLKYKVYVIPTLLYGLEALVLTKKEVTKLELYHRQNLRCMLHFPRSVATPALHLLTGIPPIEAEIHIRSLSLLRNIVSPDTSSPPSCFINEYMFRQFAVENDNPSSWTTYIRTLIKQYNLPSVLELFQNPPTKSHWCKTINKAVHLWWTSHLKDNAYDRPSMSYINLDHCGTGRLHPALKDMSCPLAVKKATIKSLLLVNRYPLTTCRTSGTRQRLLCPLCETEPESITHFILLCPKLRKSRTPYLMKILNIIREQGVEIQTNILVKAILDCNNLPRPTVEFEKTTRSMIFKIHHLRAILLGGESAYILPKTSRPGRRSSNEDRGKKRRCKIISKTV